MNATMPELLVCKNFADSFLLPCGMPTPEHLAAVVNKIISLVHFDHERWWRDPATGAKLTRNVGETLMLLVSEAGEAMEADRKNLNDSHLPHRKGRDVELVDIFIRLMDMMGGWNVDGGSIFVEKLEYNRKRVDHTHEHRLNDPNGKRY